MFDLEYLWTVQLRTETPLHVGSGEEFMHPAGAEAPDQHRVAAIVRDYLGRPVIPGSTLKGALRALAAEGSQGPDWDILWGSIIAEGGGKMGRLTVFAAECAEPGPLPGETPVLARIRLDPQLGVADEGALFYREIVPPGRVFTARLALRCRRAEPSAEDLALVVEIERLLSRIATEGLRLGSGSADADGRMSILSTTCKAREWVGSGYKTSDRRVQTPEWSPHRSRRSWRLTLYCRGPFLIGDGQEHRGRDGEAQIQPLRTPDGDIWTPGASLSGALRARLAWLASLDALRAGLTPEEARLEGQAAARLVFGDTTLRARLRLLDIRTEAPVTQTLSSVRIDRFSAAPVDGALFTVEAAVGARIVAEVTLDEDARASAHAERLFADLSQEGLQLGSGAGRGFGWFGVRVEPLEAA